MSTGNINFSAVIRRFAIEDPKKEILVYKDKRYTRGQLQERVSALAKSLLNLGVKRHDVVALLMYNCSEFFEVILAVNRIGAVFLPLNYRLASEEIQYIVSNAEAVALFTEKEFQQSIDLEHHRMPDLRIKVTLSEKKSEDWINHGELIQSNLGRDVLDAHVEMGELHRLMYTSGTTSLPKGVMLTYGNFYWKNMGLIWEFNIQPDDKALVVGPLYHVGGLDLSATATLYKGGSAVIVRKFNAAEFLKAVNSEKPTNTWAAPSMINMILQEPTIGSYDLSSLRYMIFGGERMPEPVMRKLLNYFPNCHPADAYGMTETVGGDTYVEKQNVLTKLGSIGRPVIHLDMQIVDEDGNQVPRGTVGEIVMRGPKVMKGYWKNEEATKKALRDGWLYSGDMGYEDENGYFYIIDRKKDMIISGGENISSLEIERVLYQHPKVLEVAVVGTSHERWGEVPKAFVVVRPNEFLEKDELIQFCDGKLARFKIPKEIVFLDELPRNPSGKVLKRQLRQHKQPTY